MQELSDDEIIGLIFLCFQGYQEDLFKSVAMLCMNYKNCFKIIDTILFLMMLNQEDFKLLRENKNILAEFYEEKSEYKIYT